MRLHQLLFVAAILVPATLLGWTAFLSQADFVREEREVVQRTTAILHEHARKVFETEELVLGWIADHVRDMNDEEIASQAVSDFLTELKIPLEQAVSIWITAADGTVLAGSQPWQRGTGIAERDFFQAQRDKELGLHVSGAFRGKATSVASFAVIRRRPSPDGSFKGTIHVALSPEYFSRFFAEASPPYPHTALLVRTDGEVLARDPYRAGPERLGPDSLLRKAIAATPQGGFYSGVSTVDGKDRVNSFSKVAGYPVYVSFGIDKSVFLRRWRGNLLTFGSFAFGGSLILLFVSWLALRRAQAEEAALDRLRHETEHRLQAEERLRHAQRLEALGQLAGGIAHDFNNMLQAMTGGAALIEKNAEDTTMVRRFARMILEAGKRGASVTGRLLTFARRSDLRAEPVNVTSLLGGLQEILSHTLGSGIDVRVDVDPCLPHVLADVGQLETVLVNLATNARDAMTGGGILILGARCETVTDRAGGKPGPAPGEYVRLYVTDNGTGMDAATLARASDPFFTTKGQGEGTGLGLAMARGFAEQSGGALGIESAVGQGTTVTLWLPRIAPPPARAGGVDAAVDPAPAPAGNRPRRILLVDDEAEIREALTGQLEDETYIVLSCRNAAEALSLLATETVDLLVTDLAMPGMDGIALIREAQARRPGLPAILLTGYAGDGAALAVGGAVSGSFALLRKPVSGKELTDRIAALLTVQDRSPSLVDTARPWH